jgi:hypothetical protein
MPQRFSSFRDFVHSFSWIRFAGSYDSIASALEQLPACDVLYDWTIDFQGELLRIAYVVPRPAPPSQTTTSPSNASYAWIRPA